LAHGLALLALVGLARTSAGAEDRPATSEPVWLESNLRQLYPSRTDICLVTYTQTSGRPGFALTLRNALEHFSHYRYTIRRDSLAAERPRESRTGSIAVTFDRQNPRAQRMVVVIEAVASGRAGKPHFIELAYHPRELYVAARQKAPSWIVVEASDLSLCGSSVEDWIVEPSSAESRDYARRRWGGLIEPLRGDRQKAEAIARALVRALRPHAGIPSSAMRDAPPFEQLARAESGRDRVWCANYADIFSAACNALGIPVRKVDMQYVWSSRDKTNFEIAEGHRTTERFDRELDRWVWMDLTFDIWEAELDGEPLNMAELVQALNDERRRDRLRLVEYDPLRDAVRIVPVKGSRCGKDLMKFFRSDQRYQYARKASGP